MNWWPFRRRPTAEQLRAAFDPTEQMVDLLAAARTWNKPRGLTWAAIHATDVPVLVKARSGPPLMLLAVEIRFDVVPGSAMEDVPHATEPRQATALFFHLGNVWMPGDRIMMNLTPAEVLERNPGWEEV